MDKKYKQTENSREILDGIYTDLKNLHKEEGRGK
jgi:hypothetical protein